MWRRGFVNYDPVSWFQPVITKDQFSSQTHKLTLVHPQANR